MLSVNRPDHPLLLKALLLQLNSTRGHCYCYIVVTSAVCNLLVSPSLSLPAVPSQAPGNVVATPSSPEAIFVYWSPLPNDTLNGVLLGYRVIFWANLADGGEFSPSHDYILLIAVDIKFKHEYRYVL